MNTESIRARNVTAWLVDYRHVKKVQVLRMMAAQTARENVESKRTPNFIQRHMDSSRTYYLSSLLACRILLKKTKDDDLEAIQGMSFLEAICGLKGPSYNNRS